MAKTIGIFAHVDSGKTTLCEQILYKTNTIRSLGRVDKQNSFMDSNELERKRGITIFSGIAHFEHDGEIFYLIDTPGHTDFVCETERMMDVLDCAVLLISCTEPVQGHTLSLWKMLNKRNIPVVIFFNKADRMLSSAQEILQAVSKKLKADRIVDFSDLQSEQLIEDIASFDEELLEKYFNGDYNSELWCKRTSAMIVGRNIFPCIFGSALSGDGVDTLLYILSKYISVEHNSDGELSARIFKVMHDSGVRLCFIKIESGTLEAKQIVCGEKINELRLYSGEKYVPLTQAKAGDIVAAAGLKELKPGDTIGLLPCSSYEFTPMLSVSVKYPDNIPATTIMSYLKILQDEEPMLNAQWVEESKQILMQTMGAIQLEIIQSLMKSLFDVDISYGEKHIIYMETVAAPVIGNGHFEPLRHYAEVKLRIEPAPRGSGISFCSECSTDMLALNWQRLIETHVFEKTHKGVLTGSALTDVKIVLLNGRAHDKHTEGGDFRESVYRAIRQGLMKAQNILLEPVYSFEITVPEINIGRVMSDLSAMNAEFLPPQIDEDMAVIEGKAPASNIAGYPEQLISIARGKGDIALTPCGYQTCHNSEEIIGQIGYNATSDVANTPDSVFCSHGAGHNVPWYEADAHMHCK